MDAEAGAALRFGIGPGDGPDGGPCGGPRVRRGRSDGRHAFGFTKGLSHCPETGLVANPRHVEALLAVRPLADRAADAAPSQAATASAEALARELAELYELALLRDLPLSAFEAGASAPELRAALDRLPARGGPRGAAPARTPQTAFRGTAPGAVRGPYLSQLLLLGGGAGAADRRHVPPEPRDYLATYGAWLAVQDGRAGSCAGPAAMRSVPGMRPPARRFVATPRDLAALVRTGVGCEPFREAALFLLSGRSPLDRNWCGRESQIISLLSEAASLARRAARGRTGAGAMPLQPEALAARIERRAAIAGRHPALGALIERIERAIAPSVARIRAHNAAAGGTALLPTAFPEGGPMHPSCGAASAAVAGACTTVLKAVFDCGATLVRGLEGPAVFRHARPGDRPVACRADYRPGDPERRGDRLYESASDVPLSLGGELDKLASNLALGGAIAGVAYPSDAEAGLRLGQAVALALLREWQAGRPALGLRDFDGRAVRIGAC